MSTLTLALEQETAYGDLEVERFVSPSDDYLDFFITNTEGPRKQTLWESSLDALVRLALTDET